LVATMSTTTLKRITTREARRPDEPVTTRTTTHCAIPNQGGGPTTDAAKRAASLVPAMYTADPIQRIRIKISAKEPMS
jgi:hypothetical protein